MAPSSSFSAQILAHVERVLGPVVHVWHGRGSRFVRLHMLLVEPTDERPCFSIVTSGMSDVEMRTPKAAREWRRAELMLNLPEEWPIDEDDGAWPLKWLETLATFPHENRTWIGLGHTLPNGDPPEPLAEDTALCALLVTPPYIAGPEFARLEVARHERIYFHGVMPIYREELELVESEGAPVLDARFVAADIVDIVDLARENVAVA